MATPPRGYWEGRESAWLEQDTQTLRQWYADRDGKPLELQALAEKLGRLKSNVCRKARSIGLTNNKRTNKMTESQAAQASAKFCIWLAANGHPRGMQGKRHTDGTKMLIAWSSKMRWEQMSAEQKLDYTEKQGRSRVAKNSPPRQRTETTWKAGWRTVGGQRFFGRSRWEANIARYFEWLRCAGQIKEWKHEPQTFWFESIRRGVRSYKPDFLITPAVGEPYFVEVKGWMDARSRTTLRRMKKYYPLVKVDVIDSKRYRVLHAQCKAIVEGWEQ